MTFPTNVKIVEVGPRDGLQAERHIVPIDVRIQFINLLSKAGLKSIETGSFVSPLWVPQMGESDKVYQGITKREGIDYAVLVPNLKGYQVALENNVRSIAVFTAASETFCHKNMNASIEESLQNFKAFVPNAKENGMRVRGYISCAIACPYEGPIAPKIVHRLVEKLLFLGCDEVALGDTIGVGTPLHVTNLLTDIPAPLSQLAVHFHDTYGQAIANIYTALERGITIVDSSSSGLGGCPFAPGASGNIATEDVVYLMQGLGIETGINLEKLLKASHFIDTFLKRETTSKVGRALGMKDFL